MTKNFKRWTGITTVAVLLALAYACSKADLEVEDNTSETTTVSSVVKTGEICTCTSCSDAYDDTTGLIRRHPTCSTYTCDGGTYPAYVLYGLTFYTDRSYIDVDTVEETTLNTGSGSYHMYFYNEQGYDSCGGSNASGRPMLFLDTSKVQVYCVGKDTSVFNQYYCISSRCSPGWETDSFAYDLPYANTYRCGNVCTGVVTKSTIAEISATCQMGNNFQNTSDDQGPSDQDVFIVKITEDSSSFFYVFMVEKFKGSGSTVQYMQFKGRLLQTCN